VVSGLLQRRYAKAQAQAQYTVQYYSLVDTASALALQESLLVGDYTEKTVQAMVEGLQHKGKTENLGIPRQTKIAEFWGGYRSSEFVERLTALRQSRENIRVRSENEKRAILSQIPKIGEVFASSVLTTLGQKIEMMSHEL
jgi:hypothetical protein